MELSEIDIRRKEWPLRLIIGPDYSTLNTIVRVLLVTLLLPLILILNSLFIEKNFVLNGSSVGLAEDGNILSMFVAFPVVILLLNNACSKFVEFIEYVPELVCDKNVEDDNEGTDDSVQFALSKNKLIDFIRVLLLLGGFMFVIFNAYNRYYKYSEVYSFHDFWTTSKYPITFWLTNLYTSLVWGYLSPIIGLVLIRIIFTIYVMNKRIVNGNGFKLKPMSADGLGGFRPLADLALSMSYVTIPFYAQVLIYYYWIPKINIPFVIGIGTVFILSILLFVLPTATAHKAMEDAKERKLEPVALRFQSEYDKIILNADSSYASEKDHKGDGDKLSQISQIYTVINNSPVWPIDTKVIGRFIAVVVLPILIAIATKLIEKYVK